jgi:hypothetical protein
MCLIQIRRDQLRVWGPEKLWNETTKQEGQNTRVKNIAGKIINTSAKITRRKALATEMSV